MAIKDPIPTTTDSQRWEGVERPYGPEAVEKLRGSVHVEHTLARRGAEKLWALLHERPYVAALGASTGNQAVQQVRAGLEAIYLSGWQVAADANLARQMYPDQGLYPVNSVPEVVRAINDHQTTIASAVEEQTATTGELTRSVAAAADGAGTVTDTLTTVSQDADDSATDVERARVAARELDRLSGELNRLVGVFTV